jgi:hypothetical protein
VSREHELAILPEREELIREALSRPSGVTRPGYCTAYYSRAELRQELDEIADDRARLQSRQVPATASGSRRTATASPAAPRDHRNRQVRHQPGKRQPVKNILGAAIIGADILLGIAARQTFKGLHKETHAHMLGTVGVYVAAALLTLCVVVSVARAMSGRAAAKAAAAAPAPRAVAPFGQRRGGR